MCWWKIKGSYNIKLYRNLTFFHMKQWDYIQFELCSIILLIMCLFSWLVALYHYHLRCWFIWFWQTGGVIWVKWLNRSCKLMCNSFFLIHQDILSPLSYFTLVEKWQYIIGYKIGKDTDFIIFAFYHLTCLFWFQKLPVSSQIY